MTKRRGGTGIRQLHRPQPVARSHTGEFSSSGKVVELLATIASLHARLDECLKHARTRAELIDKSLTAAAAGETSLEFIGLKQIDLIHSTLSEVATLRETVRALDKVHHLSQSSADTSSSSVGHAAFEG